MDSFELHFLRLQQAGPDQQPHQRCLPYRPQCNYWPAAAHGSQQLPLGCLPRRCSAVDGDDVRVTSMLCRLATDSVDNPGLTAACLSRRMCCHVARRALDLSMNTFSGILPGGISALAALQSLAVASNYLVGTLPPEVTTLSSLVYAAIASLRRGKKLRFSSFCLVCWVHHYLCSLVVRCGDGTGSLTCRTTPSWAASQTASPHWATSRT